MAKSNYTGDIEKDLPHFALHVLASIVTDDERVQEYLVTHAKDSYRGDKHFGKKIAAGGGDWPQRDLLINFMFHWFDALIKNPMASGRNKRLDADFLAHVAKLAPTVPADRITGFAGNAWPGGR